MAGVLLTHLARIAICLIWAGFWAARILLTDALVHFNALELKAAFAALLGTEPVDQAFSICMIWLTGEVAFTLWSILKPGVNMLFAKTTPSLRQQVAETLTIEQLEEVLERKRKAQQEKDAKRDGNKD